MPNSLTAPVSTFLHKQLRIEAMRRLPPIFFALSLVVGNVTNAATDKQWTDVAEKSVRQVLKDSASVQFLSETVRYEAGLKFPFMCGEVNGQTLTGLERGSSYSGYKKFVADPNTVKILILDPLDASGVGQRNADFEAEWAHYCEPVGSSGPSTSSSANTPTVAWPPDGIRGHMWGSASSELGETTVVESDADSKCYTRKGDDLSVGVANFDTIAYCYYRDRLDVCIIHFTSYLNFSGVKTALFQKYGEGFKENPYIEKYNWFSPTVYVTLSYAQIGDKGSVAYIYRPISDEARLDAVQKAKQAADKL
jgi:hypothetical protein